jgi:hypothetical protein
MRPAATRSALTKSSPVHSLPPAIARFTRRTRRTRPSFLAGLRVAAGPFALGLLARRRLTTAAVPRPHHPHASLAVAKTKF